MTAHDLQPFMRIATYGRQPHSHDVRGPTSKADDLQDTQKRGARDIAIEEVISVGILVIPEEVCTKADGRNDDVSFDIDAVDPGFAPGTGTPKVGWLTSYQALQLASEVKGLDMTSFDVAEVSPPHDQGDITATLASNLAFGFFPLLALSKTRYARITLSLPASHACARCLHPCE